MGRIKGIIFDYGGTIDSHGDHWSEIIWQGYLENHIPVNKDEFRECYVYAERELAKTRHILPEHNFYDLLYIKMQIELGYLKSMTDDLSARLTGFDIDEYAGRIARYCYESAKLAVEDARPTLEKLYNQYSMVLVSNFYGNVETVLADFDLRKYFKSIIESAVVGIRKPDPRIFMLGVEALGLQPEEVLVVGDSYKKDIVPAESIGCKVAWLKGKGWTAEEDAVVHPCIIKKLSDIENSLI